MESSHSENREPSAPPQFSFITCMQQVNTDVPDTMAYAEGTWDHNADGFNV